MTHFRAGQSLTAGLLNVESTQVEDTTSRTTTSGTYADAATGGTFSAAVIVPASGAVVVEMRATQRNSGATNVITSWNASGSVSGTLYTANDTAALITQGTQNQPVDLSYRLSGMSVGETLTVTMQHKVSGGTGTIDYRQMLLQGCP